MPLIKTNVAGLLINTDSNVVINTNEAELQSYRAQVSQNKELKDVKEELAELKKMLLEIKNR